MTALTTRRSPIATPATPAALTVLANPPATEMQPATPLKKVSFGRIATKKKDTKTAYPVFPDVNGQAAIIASRILENTEAFDALKGALDTDKAELKLMVSPHYFSVNHGRHEVPSSVSVTAALPEQRLNGERKEVLVTFQNRYPQLPDEAALVPILGGRVGEFFRQAFDLKISGDKLPEAHMQELIDGIQELFGRFNALDALEVKQGIKPIKEFHAARHLQLTPAENLALDQACPIVAMIKTKGRK